MSKPARYILAAVVAFVLLGGAFSGGLLVGWLVPMKNPLDQLPLGLGSGTPISQLSLFRPFWDTWNAVTSRYVDQPVDKELLLRGAIRGMLAALNDPHTSYLDPVQYQQANQPLNGEYEGIGAYVDTTGAFLKIVSPMPGSPAEKAGLKPNDVILKVDQQDMTGLDGSLVLKKVLGPAGTQVVLTIQREGQSAPIDVTITRAKIAISSVQSKMLDNNIAYVAISTFGEKTPTELKTALTDLMAKKPKGMVLDLRNNGGGLLDTAIQVVSQFVGKGAVMYEVYGDGTRRTYEAQPGGLATDIPLVVLVNKGTASASEITAGAIQDYGRGTIVGEVTYGKGSVQSWIPLANNEGAIRITIARWITPKERQINGKGLTPDQVVPLTDADIKANQDTQLSKAVEILNNLPK